MKIVKWKGEMSSNYWSSTTNANNTDNAWHVNFNNGNDNNNNKSSTYYVRAVRGGKCELFSFASVYRAYLDCRRRKRGTINAQRFEFEASAQLFDLARELQNGTYQPSRSVCFITCRPKMREIFAADFRDRIVHHLVVRELEKIYEPAFIYDSFASRQGKGIHGAVKRLQGFMQKATKNQKVPAYCLQLDIRSFFMHIDKPILFGLLEKKLAQKQSPHRDGLLYLLHRIIFHNCRHDFLLRGRPADLEKVPAHKSLFHMPPDKGLPIGNLTSQFLANVYLNELDQYVKHVLKCRYYIRYVDDFVLLSRCPDQLVNWHKAIETFLSRSLDLTLKNDARLKPLSDGVDFLGYINRPGYRLCRNRVVNNLKSRLNQFEQEMLVSMGRNQSRLRKIKADPGRIGQLQQVLASYLGHFQHARTNRLVLSLFEKYCWLKELFYLDKGRLQNRFTYRGTFRSLTAQVRFFQRRLAPAVIFFKVGSYYEMYADDAAWASQSLGLRVCRTRRKIVPQVGFPVRLGPRMIDRVLAFGCELAMVTEGGPGQFVRQRHLMEIYKYI